MKTLYLAGPINGCTDEEANDWRQMVKEKLAGDYEFLDPMRRDYRGRELEPGIAQEIVDGDMRDIADCDIVLAVSPKPSVGTSMEVFYAHYILRRLTVVVAPPPISPWFIVNSHIQVANVMAAITYLRAIKGK